MTCIVEDCTDPARARGWCVKHWTRWQRTGDPLGLAKPTRTPRRSGSGARSPEQMVADIVDQRGPDECWPCLKKPGRDGYCVAYLPDGSRTGAHRLAWSVANGPIPDGMTIDHVCHNEAAERGECNGDPDVCPHRRCCNPAHLVPRSMIANREASPLTTTKGRRRVRHRH